MIGKMLGNYEVVAEIGAGGMGTVYRGIDRRTNQPVAIKQLKAELTRPELIERFKREGEALRELNHPNIVKMLDAVEQDEQHYLIIEYLPGGDLNTLLKNGKLPVKRTLEIALDLADALTRAHRLNIIHRDLKPANILIADDGSPRLTDFGVAHFGERERMTGTGAAIGTLDYLSPEALNGDTADVKTDIWAFGVILFEMLAGHRPFRGEKMSHVITAILTEPIPDLETLNPDIPVALVDLIYRMLERDPHTRIASVRHVGAALEDILHGRETDAPQPKERFATPTPVTEAILNNLPAQTASFIGREHELSEIKTLLNNPSNRLITIVAPGGMGKTSLALEVAQLTLNTEQKAYRHGVFMVALAPLSAAEHIVPGIAGAVGLQFGQGGSPQELLLDFFREKHLLLVLDNFEHLLDGVSIVRDILQAAPNVKILATSRERLNLSVETLVHLGGMDFPEWETPADAIRYSAVQLFMQSARRVRPDFELKANDLQYVSRICRITGGMPLGILLAAAWVEMLSPAEIATEISKSVDFLESDLRDLPERHRSMRATFEYSWNLLDQDTRQAFQKLSIFRGGFTREAAQAVTGISLRGLTMLVNKSLLQRHIETGRFDVHELVRQYAEAHLEKSGMAETTRQAHAAYFAEFLSVRWEDLKGRRQPEALNEIDPELENIRASWQHQPWHTGSETLMNMVKSLWWFSDLHNHARDCFELLEHTLHYSAFNSSEPNILELQALIRGTYSWFYAGENRASEGIFIGNQSVTALENCRNPENLMVALIGLAICVTFSDTVDLLPSLGERCMELGRQTDNKWAQAHGVFIYAVGLLNQDRLDDAYHLAIEKLPLLQDVNDRWLLGMFHLNHLGHPMFQHQDYAAARDYFDKGLHYFQEINIFVGIGSALKSLAHVCIIQQDYDGAVNYTRHALRVLSKTGQIAQSLGATEDAAHLLNLLGRHEFEVELYTMLSHHPRTTLAEKQHYNEQLAKLMTVLSPDRYTAAVERGKHLSLDDAITQLVENEEW